MEWIQKLDFVFFTLMDEEMNQMLLNKCQNCIFIPTKTTKGKI